MISTGLIIIDSVRARFLALDPSPSDPDEPPRLVEYNALTDSEAHLGDQQVFANLKGGRNRAPGAGPAHAYDDHRAQHRLEDHRRFVHEVAKRARSFVEERDLLKLVLVAEPKMLGVLRAELEPNLPSGISVAEVAADLGKRSVPAIRAALEQKGVLEPRPLGTDAYRPRGQPR